MALRIGSKTKVIFPLRAGDIVPRLNGNLIVKYAQKEYEVIGFHKFPSRLYLQDPQEPDCELIVEIEKVKPLLRKMDSMTSDEMEYYQSLLDSVADCTRDVWEVTEWLNYYMFDYKDLIGKGLAEEKIEE